MTTPQEDRIQNLVAQVATQKLQINDLIALAWSKNATKAETDAILDLREQSGHIDPNASHDAE